MTCRREDGDRPLQNVCSEGHFCKESRPPTPDPEAFVIRNRLCPDSRDRYLETHRDLDRLLLPRVLEYTGGNQHRDALLQGIARQTLRARVIDLGLQAPRSAGVGSETEK